MELWRIEFGVNSVEILVWKFLEEFSGEFSEISLRIFFYYSKVAFQEKGFLEESVKEFVNSLIHESQEGYQEHFITEHIEEKNNLTRN